MRKIIIALAVLILIPLSFSQNVEEYIKSNYIIQNNTFIPITFQKTPYGWHYQNPNSPHQIYLKDIISKQDSIYYNYKSIKLKLTPEFVKTGSFPEYSNPTKGTISPSREIGLNNNQNAIIYKNTFNDIDIGIAADSRHFYEIVKINKPQLQDINIYFKLNTNSDIYYKNKKGKFVKWTGETITTNNSIKIIHSTDKITINPPKIWDSNHTKIPAKITLTTINNQKYLIKSIPFNSTSSLSFPIYNDLYIVWETDKSLFNSDNTKYISVSSLNSTHFVVAYQDYSNLKYGTARIGHFNRTDIIWDTSESVFNGYTYDISVSSLNSTTFVVAYRDYNNYGTARIGHFTGSSISWDTDESVFNSGDTRYISVSSLDSTHFVVAYEDNSNSQYGTAIVGHFTGSSITWDTSETVFNSGETTYISVSALNQTHFVVAYRDEDNANSGTAIVGHFTGSSITWDTSETVFLSGGAYDGALCNSVSSLNSTHFVIAYRDEINSDYGTARVGHFTSSSIVWDTSASVFNSGIINYASVSSFNSSWFIIGFDYGKISVGQFTGSSIRYIYTETYYSDGRMSSVCVLNQTHFVIVFQDDDDGYSGKARIGIARKCVENSSNVKCFELICDGDNYYLSNDIYGDDNCILIDANDVVLDCQGHKITGALTARGIRTVNGPDNLTIKNCIIENFTYGIYLYGSSSNNLTNITTSSNTYGIYLSSSSSNNLTNITTSSNTYGIYLSSSSSNNLTNITTSSNTYGIYLYSSDSNTFSNASVISNNYGMFINSSDSNTIIDSSTDSNVYGIFLIQYSSGNIFTNITSERNIYGITFVGSWGNKIYDSYIYRNKYGMRFTKYPNDYYSNRNQVENTRIIGNTYGIVIDPGNYPNTLINVTWLDQVLLTLQGRLVDTNNDPVSVASFNITIKDSSGDVVWNVTRNDCVDGGVFNLLLGAVNPLYLQKGVKYRMEIAVDIGATTFTTADVTFGTGSTSEDYIYFIP